MNIHSVCILLVWCIASHAVAFEVDAPPLMSGEDVHESMTRDVVTSVTQSWGLSISPAAVAAIVAGVQNPDTQVLAHKIGADLNDYHLNSAHMVENDQFQRTFALIRRSVDQAVELSRGNARLLQPRASLAEFAGPLSQACAPGSPACGFLAALGPVLAILQIDHRADHHTGGVALDALRKGLPGIRNQTSPNLRPALDELQLELNAYVARQLLGHAFHALQDIFAHSNFIELLNARRGPPCTINSEVCDEPITGRPVRFGDPVANGFLQLLSNGFDLTSPTFTSVLNSSRSARLQSGHVNLALGANMCPDVLDLPPGFDYCHWASIKHPALNKDKPGNAEASHANHAYAFDLALFASEILWEFFLREAKLAPGVVFTSAVSSVLEGGPKTLSKGERILTFSMQQPRLTATDVTVGWVPNGSARGGAGCAAGVDFIARNERVTVPRGQRTFSLIVPVCADTWVENTETLLVVVKGDYVAFTQSQLDIRDDDEHPVPVLHGATVLTTQSLRQTGTTVQLNGEQFQKASYAEVAGKRVSTRFENSRQLKATLPPEFNRGDYTVVVVTPRGGRSGAVSFTLGPSRVANSKLGTSSKR